MREIDKNSKKGKRIVGIAFLIQFLGTILVGLLFGKDLRHYPSGMGEFVVNIIVTIFLGVVYFTWDVPKTEAPPDKLNKPKFGRSVIID